MTKKLIYFMIHPKNAIQSFKSLSHWWPCMYSCTSMSSMSLGITKWANYKPGFLHFVTKIDCDSFLFFLLLPLEVSNGSIWGLLITVERKGSAPSAYISPNIQQFEIWTIIFWISSNGGKEFDGMSTRNNLFLVKSTRTFIYWYINSIFLTSSSGTNNSHA